MINKMETLINKMEDERQLAVMGATLKAELEKLQSSVEKVNTVAASLSLVTQSQAEELDRVKSSLQLYESKLSKTMKENRILERNLRESAVKVSKLTLQLDKSNGNEGDLESMQHDDGLHPEMILPVEVWEIILKLVTNTSDLLSCCDVCTMWEDEVLRQKPCLHFTAAFPHIAKYFTRNTRKQVRLVCQEWKQSMDTMLESYDNSDLLHESHFEGVLDSAEGINRLFTEMDGYPNANPFPAKWWNIDEYYVLDEDNAAAGLDGDMFWERSLDILRRFGQHLHRLVLGYTNNKEETLRNFLQVGLGYAPNLKMLMFQSDFTCAGNIPDIILPPLDSLEYFHIQNLTTGFPLFNVILSRYGSQLKKLHICEALLSDRWNWSRELPLLEDLEITLGFRSSPDNPRPRFGHWKLRRIKSHLIHSDSMPYLQELIHHSSQTLLQIDINFGVRNPEQAAQLPWNVNLSKVEKILLENYTGSFDFLLKTPKLRHLNIRESRFELTKRVGEIVSIVKYEDRLYQSNIWVLLPYLQKVQIQKRSDASQGVPYFINRGQVHKYFRQMYDYLQERQASELEITGN